MVTAARGDVFLFSSTPPPTGGISIWTARFLDAAPRWGLAVRFRDIGPRSEDELFDRSLRTHLRRAWTDVAGPLGGIATRRPPLVHVCVSSGASFLVGLAYALVGAVCRVPTVVHVHGSLGLCSPRAIRLARRLSASSSIAFVTPSAADADAFAFPVHIDNFVPRVPKRVVREPRAGALRLVHLGWMTRSKGIFELAEAVAACDDVTLDLFGPVVKRSELEEWAALVNRIDAHGRIRYRGALRHDEVLERMTDYDALVVASHSESFGLVAAEAMMNDVPVISTPAGFVASLPPACVTPLPIGDASAIRRVLADVAARPQALASTRAAAFAVASSRFSEEAALPNWCALYDRLRTQPRLHPAADAARTIAGR